MRTISAGMDAFYTICSFLVTIGKMFKETGFKDIAVESAVIAEESIKAVIKGRQYNRTARLHKIKYKVLQRLIWKVLYSRIEPNHSEDSYELQETHKNLQIFKIT